MADELTNFLDTLSERPAKRRGRPTPVTTEALEQARSDIQFVLEQNWALVGWGLLHARTIADVRRALAPIDHAYSHRLDPFRREPTERTTVVELRELRRQILQLGEPLHAAHETVARRAELAERARLVKHEGTNAMEPDDLAQVCAVREERLEQAQAELRKLQEQREELTHRLERQEAYFAQSELLEFTRSGRYTLEPASFAKAMSGLPLIGYRQSCNRCPVDSHEGPTYAMFRVVQRALQQPLRNSEEALCIARNHLLAGRTFAHQKLRAEWYYLSSAIRKMFGDGGEQACYWIFAEFQRRTGCRSQADLLLEEENRLEA